MRRAAHESLTKRVVQNYQHTQTKEATILVLSLLAPSADLKQDRHFKRLATSMIMSVVYDYPTIMSEHDNAVEKIEKYNDHISSALTVGSYFVDIFPWMNHIPARSWLPFRCFVVNTDRGTKSDLRHGSEKGYEHLQRTLRCSEAFSIVLRLISYVFILSVISGDQLTNNKEQRGEQA